MLQTLQRNRGTSGNGSQFTTETVRAVWHKAAIVPGNDPNVFRKEVCGAWVKWSAYGTTGDYGWEIDHKKPGAGGGSDNLSNLQPLHWQNNRAKGDTWPASLADYCVVGAR